MPRLNDRPRRKSLIVLAACAAALALLAAIAAPAPAATGGASGSAPVASVESEVAFSPYRLAGASWYGPGLWGRSTACGQVLRPTLVGVANKTLPCGTQVKFAYHGKVVVAPVVDRGPYVKGRAFDLTAAAAEALDFEEVGADTLRYAVPLELARVGAFR